MKSSDMDSDTEELLRKVERENDMLFAYIAGVGKGFELATHDGTMMKSDFNQEVRDGFRAFLEDEHYD